MTCEIDNVDDDQAVAVTWRKTSGGAALADGDDYRVDQGAVVGGVQESQLTIKAEKMASFADADSFTYLCFAQSSQYDSSPASKEFVVAALVLRKLLSGCATFHLKTFDLTRSILTPIITLTQTLTQTQTQTRTLTQTLTQTPTPTQTLTLTLVLTQTVTLPWQLPVSR